MGRKTLFAGLSVAALLGCARPSAVVVGSKNFTEQTLLGEIAAQQLERRLGAKVTRKLDLGGTLLAHEALVAGQIDLYPEYTGTALSAVLKLPLSSDTFAMVIRGQDARAGGIATLSQAAKRKEPWALGVGYEFLQRPDGLRGLQKTYGLVLKGTPRTMDLGLLYEALQHADVDMVAANSTDGQLSALDVVALQDDLSYFPPYEAAFVVREVCLARDPRIRAALDELAGKITSPAMRKLNYEVAGKHRRVAEVAREFLGGF